MGENFTLQKILDDFGMETVEEMDKFIRETADDNDICRIINLCCGTIHCETRPFHDEGRGETFTDFEIICFVGKDKVYKLILEEQYVGFENGIEEVISDMIAYEKEAEGLILSSN